MCQSRDFFVLNCLFLTVLSQDGLPQNVSLQWINDFEQKVTWEPPQHPVTNCSYVLTAVSTYKPEIENHSSATSPLSLKMVMHGGFLNVSVNSSCTRYEPVPSSSVTYPDLVKDLQCFITTPTEAHCIWNQTAHTPLNLGFFYHLNNNVIKECPSYVSRDRVRTGCDLEANAKDSIVLSFNGTLNKQTVRNTFKKALIRNVRPPALQWNVTKRGGQFQIHWTPPSIEITWKYVITYKECNEKKTLGVDGVTTEFTFVPKCSYRITIQACGRLDAKTLLSDEKYFAAESDLNAWVYVAIILPLMVAVLAVLTIVYCRKNKEILFPKVPQPRDLISDISDNNNTSMGGKLYIPAEKEDSFNITLVTDP
ncbi:hypothetical protein OYC64_004599 [Pagothenia borchgrevinki]|uniref:Cytokine receptor-like factor 2-like domain-containing protein n=1 Tax=Pagothenia borchgrevinki TaxID=8213 RepID=A0ABD2FYN0_PAGBO